MAQKVITQLVDDIDGKVLADGDGETVSFGLDGTTYEIDLGSKNADKLRGLFQDYIAAGRKTGSKRGARAKQTGPSAADVRGWAKEQGMEVPDRGRIPAEVREAYDAAN